MFKYLGQIRNQINYLYFTNFTKFLLEYFRNFMKSLKILEFKTFGNFTKLLVKQFYCNLYTYGGK